MAAPTYMQVIRFGILGTVSNLLKADTVLSRCSTCGATTDAPATHTAWHETNDAAIAAAVKSAGDALTAARAATDTANAGLRNTCGVCRAAVAAYDMGAHLAFHLRRSRQDPIETPDSIHADTGVTPTA